MDCPKTKTDLTLESRRFAVDGRVETTRINSLMSETVGGVYNSEIKSPFFGFLVGVYI